jgi:hypothetical protein
VFVCDLDLVWDKRESSRFYDSTKGHPDGCFHFTLAVDRLGGDRRGEIKIDIPRPCARYRVSVSQAWFQSAANGWQREKRPTVLYTRRGSPGRTPTIIYKMSKQIRRESILTLLGRGPILHCGDRDVSLALKYVMTFFTKPQNLVYISANEQEKTHLQFLASAIRPVKVPPET